VVDPISQSDRTRTFRWVKIGLIALVGLSAGLIAIQGGADLGVVVASAGGGSAVGAGLVWYLFPDIDTLAPAAGQRYRR
jgi:hypothetical protein